MLFKVGLLRKGVLVAEDSPLNLLDELESDNLEYAFLKLCQKQDLNENLEKSYEQIKVSSKLENACGIEVKTPEAKKLTKIMALVKKNFIQAIRQP